MMVEADLIIDKCGRLPKLIVALAKYLAEVPNFIREARRLNANFMYALKTTRKGLDSFQDVFTWMYSRFQACPQLLRKCIFYLSLFTQSSVIRQNRLVRRWIAEGYCEGTDSNSMVEYTEKLIHELLTIGMMETHTRAGDMRTTSCQINSLFLDYFISREMEENIFLPLEVSVLVQDSTMSTQRAGQHLAIGSSWRRDRFVFESLDFSRLRSLTVSKEWKPFFISDRMRVLRVLDLEDTSITDDDVEETVKKLPRLKFLSLRRCTKVSRLPDLLGDLRQLQSLDIKYTSVTKLPKSIIKLQKLQYINAGTKVASTDEEPSTPRRSRQHGHVVDACDGVMVPGGIGALIAMHTLGVVNVNARGGRGTLKELKNLTQLHKLGVSGISRSNFKGLFSAILSHSHLESLSLQLHMDKDLDWLAKLTPPGNLQRLKIHVHVEKYTHWSSLQALGQVRRLQTLSFRFKTDQDVELQFSDMMDSGTWYTPNQFCELKVLEIACSSNLHMKFAENEMTELELLKVHCLEGSSLMFSGIERPAKLKHVWLKGSFDDTVKAELRQKVKQHHNKNLDLKLD
jgi:hypothetical protein